MKRFTMMLAALLLAGCATYNGGGLKPGEARLEDVLRVGRHVPPGGGGRLHSQAEK